MEDRYLFKAKRVDNGKWVTWNIFSGLYGADIDKSTICQCTGLKDKNGKLIWMNDIVRDECGCVKPSKLPIGIKHNLWSAKSFEVEVVGNTFDNPELLESEEK